MFIVEEKYGKQRQDRSIQAARTIETFDDDAGTDSSTDSEDEDDEGLLVSEALDAQIEATLKAIRTRDPRVYDVKSRFYTDEIDETDGNVENRDRKDKPMYLSDYHRRNLMDCFTGDEDEAENPMTYAQEQENLKSMIVREMHAAANGIDHQNKNGHDRDGLDEDSEDEDGFLVRKSFQPNAVLPKAPKKPIQLNVETADQDPDSYLSNFMAARAWIPSTGSQLQPFESDDEEEDRRAEAFEEAYNLRFENPNIVNEKLVSHARDAAAKYSVRKADINSRKKTRGSERAKREAEKREREEEKARLRKLRITEAEEKVKKIKKAAGMSGKYIAVEDWAAFIDEGWDDERWDEEMRKRFGENYYAEKDYPDDEDSHSTRKVKKPKWEDDIDIKDLVPDFESGDGTNGAQFTLSESEDEGTSLVVAEDKLSDDTMSTRRTISKAGNKSNAKRIRDERKMVARKDRRAIEKLVDEKLTAEDTLSRASDKKTGYFRYRETSPLTFGLTPRDILMASDSQLNQYAGLKKMATFRDAGKKRKDKKNLSKKARLRDWRKETFGNEDGPQRSLGELLTE